MQKLGEYNRNAWHENARHPILVSALHRDRIQDISTRYLNTALLHKSNRSLNEAGGTSVVAIGSIYRCIFFSVSHSLCRRRTNYDTIDKVGARIVDLHDNLYIPSHIHLEYWQVRHPFGVKP